jgi:asparagine synthase (glutamine-hydrolysing)
MAKLFWFAQYAVAWMMAGMCGIAGVWNRSGEPVQQTVLERMARTMRHRGPDGEGFFCSGNLGLAHRRLSIIDLSERGHQPMSTEDGRFWITFNGEIHNFVELRQELEARGEVFHSHTDTEVALRAWRVWGVSCFEKFNGMWALAIWDDRERRLLLSRDRFGIKPLVYSENGRRFAFASEPKAILAAFPEERRPDLAELDAYLTGAFPDTGEQTFFAGIRNVPPGHCLSVDIDRITSTRHWNFEPGTEAPRPDAAERFRELLTDAVRIRLRSDVPVSAALSGGLDSSAVTRLAANFVDRPISCFCVKYDEKEIDESEYAIAATAGSGQFQLNWVRPTPDRFIETLGKIVWHHDAPPALRGRYPGWFVMEAVGKQGRVLLTGDGSDEQLAGYDRFILPYLIDRLLLRGSDSRLSVPAEIWKLRDATPGKVGIGQRMFVAPVLQRLDLLAWLHFQVQHPDLSRANVSVDRRRFADAWVLKDSARPYRSRLNNALWHDFTFMGLPETLHFSDALSMAFSVEVRAPFLDHRLVEFCFSLPFDEKIRNGRTKSLLRRALHDVLPPVVRDRRRKLGFPFPTRAWMMREDNFQQACSLLLDGVCASNGIFDRARLEKRIASTRRGGILYRSMEPFWRLVCTELWHRQFISSTD